MERVEITEVGEAMEEWMNLSQVSLLLYSSLPRSYNIVCVRHISLVFLYQCCGRIIQNLFLPILRIPMLLDFEISLFGILWNEFSKSYSLLYFWIIVSFFHCHSPGLPLVSVSPIRRHNFINNHMHSFHWYKYNKWLIISAETVFETKNIIAEEEKKADRSWLSRWTLAAVFFSLKLNTREFKWSLEAKLQIAEEEKYHCRNRVLNAYILLPSSSGSKLWRFLINCTHPWLTT